MPYSAARQARLLAPGLIGRRRLPSLALRLAETVVRRRVMALEDAAARALFTLYSRAFEDIRRAAESLPGPDRAWQDRVNAEAERALRRLADQAAAVALRAAAAAYLGGYYGRAWALDMATRPEVVIKRPPLSGLDGALSEDLIDDLIRSLLGVAWRAQFEDELDLLIAQIRIAIRTGQAEGEGIDAIMRRVRRAMGVETDRRRGPVGSNERRVYRANFNRIQVITRTVTNSAANAGAVEAYRRNADVLSGYEWLTARDERVCAVCRGLDGTTYRLGDTTRPPAHPQCRCGVAPAIRPEYAALFSEAPRQTFEEWAAGVGGLPDAFMKPTQARLL